MSTFPVEGVRFLAELANHNDREWFGAHKTEFEEFINKLSQNFLESFKDKLASLLGPEIEGNLYRIYRVVW
jgi:uncharacterized protein (DUF2461 family)